MGGVREGLSGGEPPPRILAVDTATRSCSVAVTESEGVLAEMTVVRRQTHSRHLMEMIHAVLSAAGLGVGDLDALAVTRGPGSFTGLRIGISTVKGLALAACKPLIGISTLEALAAGLCFSSDPICPVLDARKGEVYIARYRYAGGKLTQEKTARALSPDAAVSGIASPHLFVGNGALLYREQITARLGELARFAAPAHHIIRAEMVARLARVRLIRGEADPLATFAPRYIRKSDAELSFGRKP
ncbi:tRNA (adenosine(37)-N6)-threonylcarbamoyltransfe rase complex dimerization subunit type 1 TsaB [Desulfonema ishimotonii]|uniref:tRNA (Adenosine(37)-N6)-threonylcarbamoyltransfe rase complex dimerization subunit type 1 TsaB n=1 Tax=Desulfonema ishimotonii TaxID=45657 RepID=A0A401FRN1_9BACT|nr:tRNA (adenosine(37)-N6)-threonylcarbamoyltransferase complex dimerization subunit type 1 TsaB [Desulfonema ishimotonii]GBC59618.1 tRNA (adenosine(37)-N6)-threonylcarbamoyltransfe rase complex dimerization subunit type 1 TsaB [Desulfonema ishimotonii]